ncbi:hypothetical protein BU16DRAFT_453837 [Lophium mytilinum]|uniref:Rab-GAP TBC domain-containing protein n=1 Tax=Lophium mytilinum TaxID=390894 RepID=A0A6A6R7N7_9PEZI|nr:hypothetical protein BU16DRAFT_453837 [Lophium mytilinum]
MLSLEADNSSLSHPYPYLFGPPSPRLNSFPEHEYVRSLIRSAEEHCIKHPRIHDLSASNPSPLCPLKLQRTLPRTLMATMVFSREASMAVEPAPGSPPDLTNSKSSKSSSFHSSCLSDFAGPHDISHFEDINLEDLQAGLPADPYHHYAPHAAFEHARPPARSSVSVPGNRSGANAVNTFRDLTSGGKPRYPSLKAQTSSVVRGQPNLNVSRPLRRGFTSPSAPSLTNTGFTPSTHRTASRSPSPSHSQVYSTASPRSLSRRSSRTNLDVSPGTAHNTRRQSWQQSTRKTVKEREAECDQEDDEELPEDAIILGVPISPRPPSERRFTISANSSPPTLNPSEQDPQSASRTPEDSRNPSRDPSPASAAPFDSSLALSHVPTESSPPVGGQPPLRARTQSWQNTYSGLDPDAKLLTEALEQYQEDADQRYEERIQNGGSPRSSEEKQKTKTSVVELPPLRTGDPLVDPFGISKEKEKYLSRTRPSWLPPKDPKEEKKHLREYKKMQQRAQEAKQRETEKAHKIAQLKQELEMARGKHWEEVILPTLGNPAIQFDYSGNRKQWWSGIPEKTRGRAWEGAVGNELELSPESFAAALNKAKLRQEELELTKDVNSPEYAIYTLIHSSFTKDVYPELGLFQDDQPLHQELVDLCLAYTSYRPDTLRFASHIPSLAAVLMLHMPQPQAFMCMANVLNRPVPMSFHTADASGKHQTYQLTFDTIAKKLPALYAHFMAVDVPPEVFDAFFLSVFTRALPVDSACRLMDVYVFENDKTLIRGILAVLTLLEHELYGSRKEIMGVLGGSFHGLAKDEAHFVDVFMKAGKAN